VQQHNIVTWIAAAAAVAVIVVGAVEVIRGHLTFQEFSVAAGAVGGGAALGAGVGRGLSAAGDRVAMGLAAINPPPPDVDEDGHGPDEPPKKTTRRSAVD
jgi:hypothetical protein